jgi:hypothetical protein
MPTKADRHLADLRGDMPSPMMFGADGNFRQVFDGAMTAGGSVLTCATSAPFVADHYNGDGTNNGTNKLITEVGRLIWVDRAGPDAVTAGRAVSSGGNTTWISGKIKAYISPTQVKVCNLDGSALNATTSVSGAWVIWGFDDTAAWQAFLDSDPPGRIFDGVGRDYLVSTLQVISNSELRNFGFWSLPSSVAGASPINMNGAPSTFRGGDGVPVMDVTIRHGYINGLRHFQVGMTVTPAENGGRHGIRVLGKASDILLDDMLVEYCAADGVEWFSGNALTTSDSDATRCFQRIVMQSCIFRFNRRHGYSVDSMMGLRATTVQTYGNGLDVTVPSGTPDSAPTYVPVWTPRTEGDCGDRASEEFPVGSFIPAGATSGSDMFRQYQYGLGFDVEGYGIGSRCTDMIFTACRSFANASYAYTFQDAALPTDAGFIVRNNITFIGGFYAPGNYLQPGNEFCCVFYGGNAAMSATLTANASSGATSISVSASTALAPGAQITFQSGATEVAIVSGSYIPGNTTVPLTSPLLNSYSGGSGIKWVNWALTGKYQNISLIGVSLNNIQANAVTGLRLIGCSVTRWSSTAGAWKVFSEVFDCQEEGTVFNGSFVDYMPQCDPPAVGAVLKGGAMPPQLYAHVRETHQAVFSPVPSTDPAVPPIQVGVYSPTETFDIGFQVADNVGSSHAGAQTIGTGNGTTETTIVIRGGWRTTGNDSRVDLKRGNAIDGWNYLVKFGDEMRIDGHPVIFDSTNRVGLFFGTNDPNDATSNPTDLTKGVVMGGIKYTYLGIGSKYYRGYSGTVQPVEYVKTTAAQGTGWMANTVGLSSISLADQQVAYGNSGALVGDATLVYDYAHNIFSLLAASTVIPELRVGKAGGGSNITSKLRFMNGPSGEVASIVADPDQNTDYALLITVNGVPRLKFRANTNVYEMIAPNSQQPEIQFGQQSGGATATSRFRFMNGTSEVAAIYSDPDQSGNYAVAFRSNNAESFRILDNQAVSLNGSIPLLWDRANGVGIYYTTSPPSGSTIVMGGVTYYPGVGSLCMVRDSTAGHSSWTFDAVSGWVPGGGVQWEAPFPDGNVRLVGVNAAKHLVELKLDLTNANYIDATGIASVADPAGKVVVQSGAVLKGISDADLAARIITAEYGTTFSVLATEVATGLLNNLTAAGDVANIIAPYILTLGNLAAVLDSRYMQSGAVDAAIAAYITANIGGIASAVTGTTEFNTAINAAVSGKADHGNYGLTLTGSPVSGGSVTI